MPLSTEFKPTGKPDLVKQATATQRSVGHWRYLPGAGESLWTL